MHIKSNMCRLGRIGIFSETIHKFLVNLKRNYPEPFATLNDAIIDKYLSEKEMECFSRVKPSQSRKILDEVSKDLSELVRQFGFYGQVSAMYSYKLLERVLKEHSLNNDKDHPVKLKEAKEIPSDSLQNPLDHNLQRPQMTKGV